MIETDYDDDYTLVFDHFYTNNHIQILKSLLPFFGTETFSFLPVLIKYLELQHTLELVQNHMQPCNSGIHAASSQSPNWEAIYKSIKKYLAPHEEKRLRQLLDLMHTVENMKEMQKMMELFQNMTSDENNPSTPFPDLSNLEHLLKNGLDMGDFMGGNFDIGEMMQLLNAMK